MSDLALLQPRSMSKSLMLDETRLQGHRLERFHVNQGCEDPAVVLERHTHAGVDGCKVDVWRHTHLQESLSDDFSADGSLAAGCFREEVRPVALQQIHHIKGQLYVLQENQQVLT